MFQGLYKSRVLRHLSMLQTSQHRTRLIPPHFSSVSALRMNRDGSLLEKHEEHDVTFSGTNPGHALN